PDKKPGVRFQSRHDLVFALGMVSTPSAASAVVTDAATASSRSSALATRERLIWIAATSAATLLAIGLAAKMFSSPAAEPEPPRLVSSARLPPPNRSLSSLAISPDGRLLAFTAVTGGKAQLWVRPLESASARGPRAPKGAATPFWPPDSRSIAFAANGKLKRIAASGGAAQSLCDAGVFFGGTW